jgi:hypothetical protein
MSRASTSLVVAVLLAMGASCNSSSGGTDGGGGTTSGSGGHVGGSGGGSLGGSGGHASGGQGGIDNLCLSQGQTCGATGPLCCSGLACCYDSNGQASCVPGVCTGSQGGHGGTGGALGAGGQGGATGGAGGHGTACGSGTPCAAGQVCVHPSCGGGVPFCEKLPDGGQCPSGWSLTTNCTAGGGGPGCTPPACTPPAPFCADVPAACSGTPSCNCLPGDVCVQNGGSGSCEFANASGVTCGSA